jgi:GrpB-like predicted nucleotidyltransferase (UPF0157 family)
MLRRALEFVQMTSLTEAQIMVVHIEPPSELNSTVHLAPYDTFWPLLFSQLEKQIQEALGLKALLLEHVGSTAVPGLSAKPIIDIVLAVADSSDEPAYVPLLEAIGYTLKIREPGWFQHRLLKPLETPGNLHVFSIGCKEIERMVLFRDWLRKNPDDRFLYEETKRTLAAHIWKYTQNYADAKGDVVQAILARARCNQGLKKGTDPMPLT